MKGFNQIQIIGNLGADPVMKYTPNMKAVTTFEVATSRRFKGDNGQTIEQTEWHKIVAWDKLAEICNQKLVKGMAVFVTGRMTYPKWEDKDQVKHRGSEIIAHDVIFFAMPAGTQEETEE